MVYSRASQQALAGKRIVTIGGGTGPFAVLSSLKHLPCSITAIVSMADSGGSSRRLMDEFGQLPLGDLRQALVALSRHGVLWRDIFNFRFRSPSESRRESGVSGHSLGNLIISALSDMNEGDLLAALQDVQGLLETAGDVLPVTLERTTLCAELENGDIIEGETNIDLRGEHHPGPLSPIRRIFLDHRTAACDQALLAIRQADVIIIGPGDLYTSILPNLLVEGVAEAIRESAAEKVYVCNLMTKHGETDGYTAADYLGAICRYLGGPVDRAILHDGRFSEALLTSYAEQNQFPVIANVEAVRKLATTVTVERLTAPHVDYVRHDSERLVRAILAPYLHESMALPAALLAMHLDF
jgi:uncharacterized cofD-like protein